MTSATPEEHSDSAEMDQEIIDLVIARLNTMPTDATLSIGGNKNLTLSEVINGVREQSELGRAVVEEQMEYLRSLKDLLADDVG